MLLSLLPFIFYFVGDVSYHCLFYTSLIQKSFNNLTEDKILTHLDKEDLLNNFDTKKYIESLNKKYIIKDKNVLLIDNLNLRNYKKKPEDKKNIYIKKNKKGKLEKIIQKFRKTEEDDCINWYKARKWYSKMKHLNNIEKLYIHSYDKLNLAGFLIKNNIENNNKFVIICHGFGGNHFCHLDIGMGFYKLGFNVLFIDQRAYGDSEGKYSSLGWKESIDIYKWINYIVKRFSNSNIVLWGISMGGASVMRTCSMNLPKNVKLCISDCGFNKFTDVAKDVVRKLKIPKIIGYPIIYSIILMARLRNKTNLLYSCSEYLKKSKLPLLLFHGTNDILVPVKNSIDIFKSYNNNKKLVLVKYADHCKASVFTKDLYWKIIYDQTRFGS